MARLTSVANVKRYLAITTPNQDALIDKLIPAESATAERYTGRSFSSLSTNAKRLNGTGTRSMVLHEQPIVNVTSVTVDGSSTPLVFSTDGVSGDFVFDDTALYLINGNKFSPGKMNVAVAWTAGYQATENTTLGANVPLTFEPNANGFATVDRGVTANGSALVASAGGANAPLAGQYLFAAGVYTFNAAQANAAVSATFDFCPGDVEQAVIEMVGLDLKQRDNLGVASKSLAGESITYEKAGMSKSVLQGLTPYRRMAPA